AGDVEMRAERHEDFALAQDGGWAVALDLDLDDALRLEGTARQLARAVNELRKKLELDLTDRIVVEITGAGPKTGAVAATHGPWIAGEVLATDIVVDDGAAASEGHPIDLDGDHVAVEVRISASS
ncbi:MAG: DUF5915 domain-containing protein, partial [Actinomycetota bacterium]|nr:DUF5915 domain-containing protein [Actinomycetota bacterium]